MPLAMPSCTNTVTRNIKINVNCGPHKRGTDHVLELDKASLVFEADPLDVGMSLLDGEDTHHSAPV